ncbi:MAG: hypothetical protein ACRDIL_16710 [Candidatus Limnocylindrales bacterium]
MTRARILATLDRRPVAVGLSVAVFLLPVLFVLAIPDPLEQPLGVDVALYRDAAARWFDGGPFYEARQLTGPYEVAHGDILYPPVGLWLFVPFAVLPDTLALVLWWAIPGAVTAVAVHRMRTRPAAWPLIALCLAWPTTPLKIWTGNPVIWSVAAMAVAIMWRGGAPFALLKPSLFPFALFGIRDRSWWLGLAAFVLLCLPFGSLWFDWLASVQNARGAGLLYSSLEAPMLALPLVAWLGRTRGPAGTTRRYGILNTTMDHPPEAPP